eukprot:4011413-Pleurochrysis_carterae.AAC.1
MNAEADTTARMPNTIDARTSLAANAQTPTIRSRSSALSVALTAFMFVCFQPVAVKIVAIDDSLDDGQVRSRAHDCRFTQRRLSCSEQNHESLRVKEDTDNRA